MTSPDPISVAIEVVAVLDHIGIPYVVGGSVAASMMGEPRSTLDLDLMIDCGEDDARQLAAELERFCYVDAESAADASLRRSSFNAIHLATSLKIDFFFAEQKAFAREAMAHRRPLSVRGTKIFFYSPEDLIVRKLHWYRLGQQASERQWRDVLGIIRLHRTSLDVTRLRSAARDAEVADLLERVLTDAG